MTKEPKDNRIENEDDPQNGAGTTCAVASEVASGASNVPVGQGPRPCREDGAGFRGDADGWIETSLTNDEAAAILRGADSGIAPDLSRRGYRFAKRAFDVVASGAAIAVLLVPGAVLSAVICAKSPGAGPLYSQLRVGRLGRDGTYRLFRMWKFRSMVPHADEMLKDLIDKNEADGPLFKIKDDPRIIPGIGKFIRKHSIDELPQLINVFAGDMSLVGPRPALPREVAAYDERAKRTLCAKPGCGGVWQASTRSDSLFDEK
ncbi:MAG: sugar transferase, partial [Rikenellaceae bacterium]|nr:sugar transferase [Rikenellaceae bacterium]